MSEIRTTSDLQNPAFSIEFKFSFVELNKKDKNVKEVNYNFISRF